MFLANKKKHRHRIRGSGVGELFVAVDCWGPPNLRHPTLNPSSALTRPTTVFERSAPSSALQVMKNLDMARCDSTFLRWFCLWFEWDLPYLRYIEAVTQMCWWFFWESGMRAPLSRHVLRVLCISTVCIHAAENQYSAFQENFLDPGWSWFQHGVS